MTSGRGGERTDLLEWDARSYDSLPLPHERWGADAVEALGLHGDEVVADLGCGTGRDTELLLARLPRGHVVAVDGSEQMLARLRSRLAGPADRVTVVRADLRDPLDALPQVDAVLSVATLHWIPDHASLFRSIAARLRPGGRLVAEAGGLGNIARVRQALRAARVEDGRETWNFAGVEETTDRLVAAGFLEVEVALVPDPVRLHPRERLESFLATVVLGAHLRDIADPAARRALVAEVAGHLTEPVVDYVRLRIRAVRGECHPDETRPRSEGRARHEDVPARGPRRPARRRRSHERNTMTVESSPLSPADAAAGADAALARLGDALSRLGDGDLHRAHRGGGWTVAQVVSHMNLATLLWLGDLQRLRHDPDLSFFFREEIGHDAVGYPPPTVEVALGQLAAGRQTIRTCVPAIEEDLLDRSVEIPDLGRMTVREWTPIITGHVESHVAQAFDIMRDRGFLPAGF